MVLLDWFCLRLLVSWFWVCLIALLFCLRVVVLWFWFVVVACLFAFVFFLLVVCGCLFGFCVCYVYVLVCRHVSVWCGVGVIHKFGVFLAFGGLFCIWLLWVFLVGALVCYLCVLDILVGFGLVLGDFWGFWVCF